jgi:hypothetical protein
MDHMRNDQERVEIDQQNSQHMRKHRVEIGMFRVSIEHMRWPLSQDQTHQMDKPDMKQHQGPN